MVAKVLINTTAKSLNKVYDYKVPDELIDLVEIGKRVKVSFGRTTDTEGIIVKIDPDDDGENRDFKLKDILEILDEVSYMDESRLKLAKYISHIYFCNVYDAIKLMLPPGTSSKNASKSLNTKQETKVTLAKTASQIELDIENEVIKSAKHIRVLKFLIKERFVLISDIIEGLGISRAVLKTLEKNGYIMLEKYTPEPDLFSDYNVEKTSKKRPTPEQKNAIEKISYHIFEEEYKQCLLFGVTGSRKNRSIFASIRKCFKSRKKGYCTSTRNFTYFSNCK